MKKNLLLLSVLLTLIASYLDIKAQQTVTIPASNTLEYDHLKLTGQIPVAPEFHYNGTYPEIHPRPAQRNTNDFCLINRDASWTQVTFSSLDDGTSTAPITLPFNVCFYGNNYNTVYVNTNGNITFNAGFTTYTAAGFPLGGTTQIIAPFWTDVDLAGTGNGGVYYKIVGNSCYIIYDSVGRFNDLTDLLNTFEIILTDGNDPLIGVGNNCGIFYGDMQWTSGNVESPNDNGFGGAGATVGADAGNSTSFLQIGRFDQPGTAYDGPGGNNDGVDYLDNKCFTFSVCSSSNQPPSSQGLPSAPTNLCAGQTANFNVQYIGPETGQTVTITTNGTAGYVVNSNTSGNPGIIDITFTAPAVPGTYDLILTATDNGAPIATTVETISVIVSAPTPIITGTLSVCAGSPTTLDAGAGFATYAWSGPSGYTPANTQTTSTSVAGTYTVTVTDASGCQGSSSATVVSGTATVSISGNTAACQGGTVTLDAGTGFTVYSWSGPNGFTASTQTAATTVAGVYTVNVTSAAGCSGTASATLVVNTLPTPTISGSLSVCNGSSTTLDAGAYTTYSWTGPSSFTANTQQITITVAGTYTVTVTDANGCQASTSADVVNGSVAVTITGNTTVCVGATTTLDAGAFTTYSWSDGTSVVGTSQTLSAGAGTYTVTVTNNLGCQGTDTATITETPVSVNITGPLVVCAGQTTTLDAGAGFTTYTWLDPTPFPFPPAPFGNSQTLTTGAGPYAVYVTDANGCQGADTVLVVENDTLPIVITGPTGICPGGLGVTLDAGPGYLGYVWANVTSGVPALIGSSQTQVAAAPGIYGVQVQIAAGCIGIDTATVTLLAAPSPTITGNLTYCTGTTSLSTGVFTSYSWSDGTSVVGTTDSVNVAAGTYSVTVTNAEGCSGTSTASTVTQSGQVNVVISGPTSICTGGSITVDAGTGFTTYTWANVTSGTPVLVGSTQTLAVTQPGIYGVQVSNGACSGQDTIVVALGSPITPVITGSATVCPGDQSTLGVTGSFDTYSWSDGTSVVSTTSGLTTGVGTYTLTVTNNNGCGGTSAPFSVSQSTNISPTISGTTQYCQGGNTTLDAGAGFSSYAWTDVGTSQIVGTNQTYVATQGTYTVSVQQGTCSGVSAQTVVTEIAIPTVTASIQGLDSVCQGQTVTLTATGASTYTWTPGNQTGASIQVTAGGNYTVLGEAIPGCGATSLPVVVTILPLPTVTISASGPTQFCSGSVVLTANGASTYVWGPSASTQSAITVTQSGLVTLTGTGANGCIDTASIAITSGSTLQVAISSSTGSNVVCSGQPVTLDGTTSGAASYSWSPGGATTPTISINNSGTYTLTVLDGTGCVSTSAPFPITVGTTPVPVVSSSNNSNVICDASTPITLSTSGNFVTYQWSNNTTSLGTGSSITVNQPGSYSVTVTNASGCDGTSNSFFVSLSPTSLVIVANGPTTFCEGTGIFDQVGFDATAGFDNYLWTSGSTTEDISTNVAGSYFVTAYNPCFPFVPNTPPNNGGITSNTIVVTVVPHINCYIANNGDTLQALPPAFGYQWYNGGIAITGATNQQYVATQTGDYTVVTQDSAGCGSDTSSIYSFEFKPGNIGFEDIDGVTGLNIFPNPTSDFINIEGTITNAIQLSATIADVCGRAVLQPLSLQGNGFFTKQINVSGLSEGVYFITLKANETGITKRIIIQ